MGLITHLSAIGDIYRSLTVEGAYERYQEHVARVHPGHEVLAFEEWFIREQERKWSGINRCC